MHWQAYTVVGLALIFAYLIGVHGAGNVVSTVISSRAFGPRTALAIGAAAEFLGPFVFGTAVASTIGAQILNPGQVTLEILLAALLAAIGWHALTWYLGIPSSSSHGLVGGMTGAALMSSGPGALQSIGLIKVLLGLFLAPLFGFILGYVLLRLIYILTSGASPRVNDLFRRGQLLTVLGLALTHGANDAQKAMGIIGLALFLSGYLGSFSVPLWVIVTSAGAMALGTAMGGWRLIRTLGGKFFKVRPVHSFSSQLSSTLVILAASLFGWPVSTAQVVSPAILGVGAAERINKVRWGVAADIVMAWLLTIPLTAGLSALIYLGLTRVLL